MPTFELIIGDCREKLKELPKESVDLVISSPPYKRDDGYSPELIRDTAHALRRVMKPGGRLWINFGQLKEDYQRPLEVYSIMCLEFVPVQTCIWIKSAAFDGVQKGHYTPINSKTVMNYGFEFLFQFINGPKAARDLDRIAIGVPFTDPKNADRGDRGKNGGLHCPGDVFHVELPEDSWFIPYGTTGKTQKKGHEYQFPEELVRRLIKVSNLEPGSLVLDPFFGSGVVAKVANELGFNAGGIEIDKDKVVYV